MTRHRHNWAPAAPIAPKWDTGNVLAQQVAASPKLTHAACACGAVRSILATNRRRNIYVTRDGPRGRRLWRGRRR